MRLATKLGVVLVAAMALVLAINSYVGVHRERRYFGQEIRHEARVVGRALRLVLRDVLATHGEARARALVDEIDRMETSMDLRWVVLDDDAIGPEPRLPRAEVEAALGADGVATLLSVGEEQSFTYVVLPLRGPPRAALEITRSLAEQRALVRRRIIERALTSLTMVAVAALFAVLLTSWLVGRPLHELTAKARRIGEGDLGGPLILGRRDELGDLAEEMNAMCDRLSAANAHAKGETAARMRALEQLQHADRLATVGRIASGLAHDLATPLNIVSGWARLLATPEPDAERRLVATAAIHDQVDRMSQVIRQLLDFAGPRRRSSQTRIDIGDAVLRIVSLLEPLANKRQVAVDASACGVGTMINADPIQLQHAISNVVMNAIDAMPSGGRLTVTTRHEQQLFCVNVSDTGVGIDPGDLPHIFDPFFTTKNVGFGTGLGLSIARDIVREHGGDITVVSAPQSGTTFTIQLPEAP